MAYLDGEFVVVVVSRLAKHKATRQDPSLHLARQLIRRCRGTGQECNRRHDWSRKTVWATSSSAIQPKQTPQKKEVMSRAHCLCYRHAFRLLATSPSHRNAHLVSGKRRKPQPPNRLHLCQAPPKPQIESNRIHGSKWGGNLNLPTPGARKKKTPRNTCLLRRGEQTLGKENAHHPPAAPRPRSSPCESG